MDFIAWRSAQAQRAVIFQPLSRAKIECGDAASGYATNIGIFMRFARREHLTPTNA